MKKDNESTYMVHLNELRKRSIRILIAFILFLAVGFYATPTILEIIKSTSLKVDLDLNIFHITDSLYLYIKVSSLFSFIAVFPYCLLELWLFIEPGLSKKEKRFFLRYIPIISILFIVGLLFAYFIIIPYYIMFSQKLATINHLKIIIGAKEYIDFIIKIIFPFGITFQLPIFVFVLSKIGIIHHQLLKLLKPYAYIVLLIISACITPPDPVSMGIVFMPLAFLYEISIWIAKKIDRKRINYL